MHEGPSYIVIVLLLDYGYSAMLASPHAVT